MFTQAILMEVQPTLDVIRSKPVENKKREAASEPGPTVQEVQAKSNEKSRSFTIVCYNCLQDGHIAPRCKNPRHLDSTWTAKERTIILHHIIEHKTRLQQQ